MCVSWTEQILKLGTTCCSYLGCFLQLSKDEEEDISPHMFNFREAMTQISEREEKVVEQLRELRQVCGRGKPSPGCLLHVDSTLPCLSQVLLGRPVGCTARCCQWYLSSLPTFSCCFLPCWLNWGISVLVASWSPFPSS